MMTDQETAVMVKVIIVLQVFKMRITMTQVTKEDSIVINLKIQKMMNAWLMIHLIWMVHHSTK